MKRKLDIWIILLLQFVLICIAFNKIVFKGHTHLLSHGSDGIKNNYTLLYYVQEPIEEWDDIIEFKGMAYPSVGNVFFTDNTPLISIPLRILNEITPLSKGFILHSSQLFFLLCIVISTALLYFILKRFTDNRLLLYISCLSLPLLDPQLMRLGHGLLNLSLSLPALLSILMLIKTLELEDNALRKKQTSFRKRLLLYISFFIFPIIFGLMHLYYIPIYAAFLAVGLLLYVFMSNKKPLGRRLTVPVISIVSYLIGSGLLYMFIKLTDRLKEDRLADPQGYNFSAWRLDVNDLFRSPEFLDIQSLFNVKTAGYYESYSYMGSWFIVIFVVLLVAFIVIIFSGRLRRLWNKYVSEENHGKYFFCLLMSALFCVILASGNTIHINYFDLSIDNVLSPFYWLNEDVKMIRQFRAVARFSFPVFFVVNIFSVYLIGKILNAELPRMGKMTAVAITVFILVINTRSTMQHTNEKFDYQSPFTAQEYVHNEIVPLDSIEIDSFSSILSLPAYYAGTGNFSYTIDPYNYSWMMKTMAISAYYHIPMFNRNMSRGAVAPQKEFIHMLLGRNEILLNKLKGEKILVLYDEKAYQSSVPHKREPAYEAHIKSKSFINSKMENMKLLSSVNGMKVYSWQVH